MSDRYLCKAKRTDNGEWVEGYYSKRKTGYYDNIGFHEEYKDCIIVLFSDGGITWVDVDPSTICQYTGLPDKNGNKIWENDIVNCSKDGCYGCILWDNSEAGFYFCALFDGNYEEERRLYDYADKIEVIGNIFDNPELLEPG